MKNYIPINDLEFDTWQDTLFAYVLANAGTWGISHTITDPIGDEQILWAAAWLIAKNKNTRNLTNVNTKDEIRTVYEKMLRDLVQDTIRTNVLVTSTDLLNMGLPLYKPDRKPVPNPVFKVIMKITPIGNNKAKVSISYQDPDKIKISRGKPEGSKSVEFIYGEGDNLSRTSCTHTVILTKITTEVEFPGTMAGKNVSCYARFLTGTAKPGLWNDTAVEFILLK